MGEESKGTVAHPQWSRTGIGLFRRTGARTICIADGRIGHIHT